MGSRLKQVFFKEWHTDGQKVHEQWSASLIIREMEIKHNETSLHPVRRAIIKKKQKVRSVGKDMEKREPLYTVVRNVN